MALEACIPAVVVTVIRREVAIVVIKAETRIGKCSITYKNTYKDKSCEKRRYWQGWQHGELFKPVQDIHCAFLKAFHEDIPVAIPDIASLRANC